MWMIHWLSCWAVFTSPGTACLLFVYLQLPHRRQPVQTEHYVNELNKEMETSLQCHNNTSLISVYFISTPNLYNVIVPDMNKYSSIHTSSPYNFPLYIHSVRATHNIRTHTSYTHLHFIYKSTQHILQYTVRSSSFQYSIVLSSPYYNRRQKSKIWKRNWIFRQQGDHYLPPKVCFTRYW